MARIVALSAQIEAQRERRARRAFRSVNDAIALQRLERERSKLWGELPALRLVSDNAEVDRAKAA